LSLYRRKRVVVNTPNVDIGLTKPIGITLPFNKPNGIFNQSFTNHEQVFSNLKNLLLTNKGERYMLPEFGTDIRGVLFENITSEDAFTNSINGEIESAISEWMPYLVITELETTIPSYDQRIDEQEHSVRIKLVVQIGSTNIYLPIQILISDTGTLEIREAVYNGRFS
jgi:phage baseplate assembly protein W